MSTRRTAHRVHAQVEDREVVAAVLDERLRFLGLARRVHLAPLPAEVKEAEMDELFSFIGDKKTKSTS